MFSALKAERMHYERLLALLHSEISLISEIWPSIHQISRKGDHDYEKCYLRKKDTYTLNIYNHASGCFEDVEVTEEVYRTYKRTEWNIEDNDTSFYAHEIQFSSLIGGSEDAFQNFREFIDTENNPENAIERKFLLEKLMEAIVSLSDKEQALVHALFIDGYSEKDYAKQCGVKQQAINKRKHRILKKIKKLLNWGL